MGALLLSIKRRLLGSTSGKREVPADAAATAGAEAPPPSASPPLPACLPLPTPRRVPLGGLAAELASLQQRFAALPQHQPASKEEVRARLAALQSSPAGEGGAASSPVPPVPATAGTAGGAASKTKGRSPRRLAKGTRRPAAARKPWVDIGAGPASSPEPPALAAGTSGLPVAGDAAAAASSPSAQLAKHTKLANLKRRQARRSAEGGAWAAPGGGEGGSLLSPQASEGPEAVLPQQQPSGWLSDGRLSVSGTDGSELTEGPHSARAFLHGRLTPRVLAAASRRASTASQPRSRLASEASSSEAGSRVRRTTSGSSGGRRSSSGDNGGELGLTLAPWAAPAASEPFSVPAPEPPTSSARALPELDLQAQQRWPATWAPAATELEPPDAAPSIHPSITGSPARSTTLLQRLSQADLPADLLSLRDSASLARRQSLSGRPPLPPRRRAQSLQGSQAAVGAGEAPAAVGTQTAAMQAAPSAVGQEAAASSGGGVKAPRRQRRGWLSDFAAAVPGWRGSQEKEAVGVLPPLKAAPAGEASSKPLSLSPSPSPPAAAQAVQQLKGPATDVGSPAAAEHAPAGASGHPPGLTRAQRRQQEAWGSLAGVGLADMLRQARRRTQPRQPQPQPLDLGGEEVADRENSTLSFNSSSPSKASSPTAPALHASPKPAEQQSLQESPTSPVSATKAAAGTRQSRRRTLPPPMLVESFERLAALHRARSESEQQEGGIEWRLPQPCVAAARHCVLRPALQSSEAGGSGGTFVAELHALRQRCPGGILANARRRDSLKHSTTPSPPPAAAAASPQVAEQLNGAAAPVQQSPPHSASAMESMPAGIPVRAATKAGAAAPAAVAGADVPLPGPLTASGTPRAQQEVGSEMAGIQPPEQLQHSPQQLAAQAQAAQQQAVQWRQRQVQYLRGLAPQHRGPQQVQQQQHAAQQMQAQAQLQTLAQVQHAHQQQQHQQPQVQQHMHVQAQQRQLQQVQAGQQHTRTSGQLPQHYPQTQAPVPAAPPYWWQQQQAQQRLGHTSPPQEAQAGWAHTQQQAAYQHAAWVQQQRQQQQQQQQAMASQQSPSGRRKWQVPAAAQAAAGLAPAPPHQQAAGWAQHAPPVHQYWAVGQPQHAASTYGWQQAGGAAHPAAAYGYSMPGGAPVGYQWQQQAYARPGYGGYQAQGSLPPLGQGYRR